MIAKLTKRRSRAQRVQVGDPGILGQAQPLMGMAEGLCITGPRGHLRPLAFSGGG